MRATLFDFFGTLVTYSRSRTAQGYPRADAVLRAAGIGFTYEAWLAVWDDTWARIDAEADATGVEVPMDEVFASFATALRVDGADLGPDVTSAFRAAYVDEWCAPVRLVDGVPELLRDLRAGGDRVVLVSNTHDGDMVRRLLDRFGIAAAFDAVVTSVDLGFRKPHPSIYRAALDAAGVEPAAATFVGDSYVPDFVGPRACGIDAYLVVGAGGVVPDDVPSSRRLGVATDLPVAPHVASARRERKAKREATGVASLSKYLPELHGFTFGTGRDKFPAAPPRVSGGYSPGGPTRR